MYCMIQMCNRRDLRRVVTSPCLLEEDKQDQPLSPRTQVSRLHPPTFQNFFTVGRSDTTAHFSTAWEKKSQVERVRQNFVITSLPLRNIFPGLFTSNLSLRVMAPLARQKTRLSPAGDAVVSRSRSYHSPFSQSANTLPFICHEKKNEKKKTKHLVS